MTQEERDIRRKLKILGTVAPMVTYPGLAATLGSLGRRTIVKQYEKSGEEGLVNRRPGPRNPSWRTPPEIES